MDELDEQFMESTELDESLSHPSTGPSVDDTDSDHDEVTGPLEVEEEERDSLASLPSSVHNNLTSSGPRGIMGGGLHFARQPVPSSRFAPPQPDHNLMGTSLPIRIPANSFKGPMSLMTGMAKLQQQNAHAAHGMPQHVNAPPPAAPFPDVSIAPNVDAEGDGFVPPHLLNPYNSEDAFHIMSVIEGTTPGARMKKELLKQRNRIMKATGFLEEQAAAGFNKAGPGPASVNVSAVGGAMPLQGGSRGMTGPMNVGGGVPQTAPRTPGALSGLLGKNLSSSLPKNDLYDSEISRPGL